MLVAPSPSLSLVGAGAGAVQGVEVVPHPAVGEHLGVDTAAPWNHRRLRAVAHGDRRRDVHTSTTTTTVALAAVRGGGARRGGG